ncbi:ATP-binding protein [Acidovorax sp. Root217]|uniref:ATP-binding protein n=1 Tax=Acidovorax sp. Root217 TaxID=1736492 RepID=UPI0009EA2701|nr:ATP-binding protein [Acidovorax sp. Root217]
MSTQINLFSSDEGNPLLAPLLPERSFVEWGESLSYDPRDGIIPALEFISESHFQYIDQLFITTRRAITLAMNLSAMMIGSLRRRDPRVSANRKYLFQLATFADQADAKNINKIPWLGEGASGMILRGPTGCSKTHSCDAFLRLIPQCIEHGPHDECGWISLKQLVYLRVPMPSDASRKGLLINIIWKLDEALGTDYASGITARMTQEVLLVEVLKLLTVHRCSLLVLEEVQERNVQAQILGSEFANVFLKFLNAGIPLVLVGNPLSFDHIMSFTQDRRRLTSGGLFDFTPAYDHRDEEWEQDLVPGVWGWSLLPHPDEAVPNLAQVLYERTGGIPALLSLYRRECMVEALRARASQVTVKHMDAAFWSPSMCGMHDLVEAYRNKDLNALNQRYTDQPVAYLEEIWARERRMRAPA